jgi:hypothetical protein
MVTATRLPGIQFEVVAPPANDALVRMDITAFVGFSASGPLHLPVMVEDIAHFEEIFGNDLVLATDAESNQPVYACLPSAVRAFFRNGGRRCWVIRVADVNKAESSFFPLPGLFRLEVGALSQAIAPARSPGSWADPLVAGLALRSHSVVATSFSVGSAVVGLSLSSPGEVVAGDLLRFSFPGVPGTPGNDDMFWFFVDSVATVTNTSPLSNHLGQLVSVTGTRSYWQRLTSPPSPGSLPICERITMDLFVQNDAGEIWSLTDLGLAPTHPRYWGNLPDDATLFATDTPNGLAAEAGHPRFPLAGPTQGGFYLPLGVDPAVASPPVLNELTAGFFPTTAATHSAATVLERDGLAAFGANLFLDPSLADTTSLDLLNEAYYIQYQSPAPRKLTGIHAALRIEEATIVAAPDAIQRGWYRFASDPPPLPALSSPLQHPEWFHFAECNPKQEIPRVSEPPAGQFQSCDLQIIAAPGLALNDLGGGRYELDWTPLPGAVDFLEEAVDPNFSTAVVKRQTSTGTVMIYGQPPGSYYYRVRRQIGSVSSDYSNGVAIRIDVATGWRQETATAYNDQTLLDVHRALLRMSAARGDLFAVLSVPAHYRERETAAHASRLKVNLQSEPAALSFGGVYHPWLIGREEDDLSNLRTTPPDGAMAGIMAKRSSKRGAWISPGNEPLTGAVALEPAILRGYRQLLQDSQVNLIRQEPAGFLCLSAVTLGDDDELVPINVRRLLSFLRKTALLVGNQYVFEPLSDQFRRSVQRGFEKLLDELLHREAFAGRTAREAFQVVVDGGLNTPAAADQGRFYVELKVAPSLPMRFLTVRLLQTADRTFVTEGR